MYVVHTVSLANSSVCRPASSQWFVALPFDFILLSKFFRQLMVMSFFFIPNDGLVVVGEFMTVIVGVVYGVI
jgi:hypothetical protein